MGTNNTHLDTAELAVSTAFSRLCVYSTFSVHLRRPGHNSWHAEDGLGSAVIDDNGKVAWKFEAESSIRQ
jgi:hypothetical protein